MRAQRRRGKGSKTFATNCAGCHGSDGRGGERAPNIATAQSVTSLTNAELSNFVHNGVPGSGMPAFGFLGDSGIRDVVAFLRQLQGKTTEVKVTGDDAVGRTLFFGNAGCSKCHMMHGEGGFIASDLSDYGSGIASRAHSHGDCGSENLCRSRFWRWLRLLLLVKVFAAS